MINQEHNATFGDIRTYGLVPLLEFLHYNIRRGFVFVMVVSCTHEDVERRVTSPCCKSLTSFASKGGGHAINEPTLPVRADCSWLEARPADPVITNSYLPVSSLKGKKFLAVVKLMVNVVFQWTGELHLTLPPLVSFEGSPYGLVSSWRGGTGLCTVGLFSFRFWGIS